MEYKYKYIYSGNWKNGIKHGNGVLSSDCVIVYNGEWKYDNKEGR